MSHRLPNSLLARLADASERHKVRQTEICRRAATAYRRRLAEGRVVQLRNREGTTRTGSMPIQVPGLPDLGGAHLEQVLDWYLTEFDRGGRREGPSMFGMTVDLPDGRVQYVGPITENF